MYECPTRFKDFKAKGMINKIKYQKAVVKNPIVICSALLVDWVDLFAKFLVDYNRQEKRHQITIISRFVVHLHLFTEV